MTRYYPPITYYSNGIHYAVVNGDLNSVIETPEFSLFGIGYAELSWDQAFHLTAGAHARIEITVGGTIFTLAEWTGPMDLGNPLGLSPQTPISLSQFLGQANLRIRYVFEGNPGSSWAIDNLSVTPGGGDPFPPIVYEWHEPPNTVYNGQTITVSPHTTTTYLLQVYIPVPGSDEPCYLGQVPVTVNVDEVYVIPPDYLMVPLPVNSQAVQPTPPAV
jgi:hypothetical protein